MLNSGNYTKFGVETADQKSRMSGYLKDYSSNRNGVVYDDELMDFLLPYCRDPQKMKAYLKILHKKGYAQSRKDVSQLDAQIQRYCEKHVPSKISMLSYQAALKYVSKGLPQNLQPLKYQSDEDIINALPRKDTHAGLTYILSGFKEKGDNLENIAIRYANREAKAKLEGTFNSLDLGAVRTQNSSPFTKDGKLKTGDEFPPESKTRLVHMIDLFQIIGELKYAKPLQDALKTCSWYAGGKSASDTRSRVHQVQKKGNYWYSIDYSHFDASIPGWLIRDAFSLLKTCFSRSLDEELWNVLVHDFVNKAMVKPNGDVVIAHDGIPSGSMFTQIIGSLCNYIMIVTYMMSQGIHWFDTITMGDDNLLGVSEKIDLKHLAQYMYNMFGAEINVSKVDMGTSKDPAYFLSREWRSKGEWRHPNVLLAKMAYPERERTYNEQATPAQVVYSYCLTFPLGMQEMIDLPRFVTDYQPDLSSIRNVTNAKNLNGLMKFQLLYQTNTTTEWANTVQSVKILAA